MGCIASDIGGYLFGKYLKGPKLTKISPKKTYSGAFGSIFLTTATMSFLFFNSNNALFRFIMRTSVLLC